MLNEETLPELYYDIDKGIEYCKNIENVEYKDLTYFHMYWFAGKEFGFKQTLPIKSYLATQNLNNTRLVVWSNIDLTKNSFFKPYIKYVEFRFYSSLKESMGTVLANRFDLFAVKDIMNYAGGDLFRILALNNYGGVYVDFDVVFLRDFAPLLKEEFMYKWGLEKNMINGAVMRMFKHSTLCTNLLAEINKTHPRPGSTIWSTDLYEKVRRYNKNWTIYPSAFFNSEWEDPIYNAVIPRTPQPFKKDTIIKMYEGAFSWHWHNRWDEVVEEGSKFDILNKRTDELLRIKQILI
jgi:hypothetical protein